MQKFIFIAVWGFSCFLVESHGQNQKAIDSLHLLLEHKTGGDRFPELYELSFQYSDLDNEIAINYMEKAEEAALLSGDSLNIVRSKRVKGQILYKLEKLGESILSLKSAMAISSRRNYTRETTMISNTLGSTYLHLSQYDKALYYNLQTYELGKQTNDAEFMALGLNNVGVTYYKLKEYRKGLHFMNKALDVLTGLQDFKPMTLVNISLCYFNLNDFMNAEKSAQQSLATCGSNCQDRELMHIRYATGSIAFGLKNFEKAESDFLVSYNFSKALDNRRMQFDNIYYLARICMSQKRMREALYYLDEADKKIEQGAPFNLEKLKIYSSLIELHSLLKDYKKVAHYQGKYIHLKDSIYDEALTTNLMQIESDYQERGNQAKIAEQNEVLNLKEEIINRQSILNIMTGLLAIITFTFLIFIFRSLKFKKHLNHLLENRIEERTRELHLSRDELLTALKEREIMIHRASDGIKETISTVKGLCFVGIKESVDPTARSYMDKISHENNQLNVHLKYLSHKDL